MKEAEDGRRDLQVSSLPSGTAAEIEIKVARVKQERKLTYFWRVFDST
jgi:hypothetical protein